MDLQKLLAQAQAIEPNIDNVSIRLMHRSIGDVYLVEVWEFFGRFGAGFGEEETLEAAIASALVALCGDVADIADDIPFGNEEEEE